MDLKKGTKERSKLEKAVAGALRDCINAHGPITRNFVGSAAKRIAGAIKSFLDSNLPTEAKVEVKDGD